MTAGKTDFSTFVLYSGSKTSNTTTGNVILSSGSITIPDGVSKVKLTCDGYQFNGTSIGVRVGIIINDGATQIAQGEAHAPNNGYLVAAHAANNSYTVVPGSTHTFTAQATGTGTLLATATQPYTFIVEAIG